MKKNSIITFMFAIILPVSTKKCEFNETLANCSGRKIYSSGLPKCEGSFCKTITTLDLSKNKMTILFFIGDSWKNIEQLNLTHNRLEIVSRAAFNGLSKLKVLDLSDNKLIFRSDRKGISKYSLKPLTKLEVLLIRNNPIGKLPEKAFVGLKNLKEISLKGAKNISWSPESFNHGSVRKIDLRNCSFRRLSKIAILENFRKANNPNLKELLLDDNEFICDCQMRFLASWERRKIISPKSVCRSPKNMKNVSLASDKLKPSDFQCPPNVTGESVNTTLFCGSQATFICHVHVNPRIYVRWVKDGNEIHYSLMNVLTKIGLGHNFSAYLVLQNVSSPHNGKWTCLAANDVGEDSHDFIVNVVGACAMRTNATVKKIVLIATTAWLVVAIAILVGIATNRAVSARRIRQEHIKRRSVCSCGNDFCPK